MTIWCKHVHRLELQKFFNFCAAHLPVRLDIETKFPYFLILTWLSIIRNQEFRLYILAQLVNAQHKNLKTVAVLVYGHVNIIYGHIIRLK